MNPDVITAEPSFLSFAQAAVRLGVELAQVRQLVRDRKLVAVRRDSEPVIPADFVAGGAVLAGLPGTITLLADAGFTDEEIVAWLYDGGADAAAAPIALLRGGHGREVHRRAQVAGF